MDSWREAVESLYPDLLHGTICVPPLHFNRVPYVKDTVPGTGQAAFVLHPPSGAAPVHNIPPTSQPPTQYSLWTQESDPQATPSRVQDGDILDDSAQHCAIRNLQKLGENRRETMCILSQLNFGSYLRKPCFAAAAAQLPRPINLAQHYHSGDFDILLFHRHYGILIGGSKGCRLVPESERCYCG